MKNLIFIFVLLFMFSSCGILKKDKTEQKTQETVKTEPEENKTATATGSSEEKEERKKSTGLGEIEYNLKEIPSGVEYKGKIVASARWDDDNGDNILLVTETKKKEVPDKKYPEETVFEKELYGYHYILSGSSAKLLWKIQDFEKDCMFDITLEYIPKSLSITDLNNNGIAESTFIYKMTCRGDVSPALFKLMMHENENKYAIRGEGIVKTPTESYGTGKMNVDKSFNDAPDEFLKYAKEQWNKFKFERFE